MAVPANNDTLLPGADDVVPNVCGREQTTPQMVDMVQTVAVDRSTRDKTLESEKQ